MIHFIIFVCVFTCLRVLDLTVHYSQSAKGSRMFRQLLKYILVGVYAIRVDDTELSGTNWYDPCTAKGYLGKCLLIREHGGKYSKVILR